MDRRPPAAEEHSAKRFKSDQSFTPTSGPSNKLVGTTVTLTCNYFPVSFGKLEVHQYHIEFDPPIESRPLRGGLLSNLAPIIGNIFVLHSQILFLPHKLKSDIETQVTSNPKKGKGEPTTYKVTIKQLQNPDTANIFNCMNLLVKKLMRALKLEQIGRSYFDPRKAVRVRGRDGQTAFELWPGYQATLERLQSGPYLLTEVKHKVMRNDSVYSFIRGMRQDEALAALRDKIIRTCYNNKTYRITNLDYKNRLHEITFIDKKIEKSISVMEYMQRTYPNQMKNIDSHQPVIESTYTNKRTGYTWTAYLIPQLCLMSGLTDEMRNDFGMMKEFKNHTLIAPGERMRQLKDLLHGFSDPGLREAAKEKGWIQISTDPLRLPGRILPAERIMMKGPKGDEPVDNRDADWGQFHKQRLHFWRTSDHSLRWMIIHHNGRDFDLRSVIDSMMKVAYGAGVQLEDPETHEVRGISGEDYASTINAHLDYDKRIDFVLCILPNTNKDRYDRIKQIHFKERPTISQCVTAKVLGKSLMSVCTKLMLQITTKIGGCPWVLNFTEVLPKATMVVGINIASFSGKSVVGMVASMDKNISSFYSRVYRQAPGQPKITQLGSFIKDACVEFKKGIDKFPAAIVIYRDGAGEGQIKSVLEDEYKQVEDTLKAGGVTAEVVFVISQKRINTRFFKDGSNVPAGTLVDSVVTATKDRHEHLGTTFDFYLVGQSHMQGNRPAAGTMNPARYWVKHPRLGEERCLTAEQIQRLTFKLCHIFYNWSGTVSIPALTKYAEVLAKLVVTSVGDEVKPALHRKTYYL